MRARRLASNWSQKDLADRANVSVHLVSDIEGGRPIRRTKAAALAQALGVPLGDLTAGSSQQATRPSPPLPTSPSADQIRRFVLGLDAMCEALALRVDVLERRAKVWALVFRGEELRVQDRPDEAQIVFEMALNEDPSQEDALIGLAKIFRHHHKDLRGGIGFLDKAIKSRANYARAWYNRACYKQLSGAPKKEVLRDLREALRLHPTYAKYAISDPDFAGLRLDTDFINVVKRKRQGG